MPVMGPDLRGSYEHGRSVGEELYHKIMKDHHLSPPKENWPLLGCKERWEELKEQFIHTVGKFFEEDAANGF